MKIKPKYKLTTSEYLFNPWLVCIPIHPRRFESSRKQIKKP